MTDLTEQWKKGELPEGEKYIQLRDNRIFTAYFNGKEFREVYNSDIKEILAEVPTFEELRANQKWIKSLEEKIKIYERKDKQATETSIAYNELAKENEELKEIISLKKEYKAECNRADELEDSLHISWQNESKLKKQLEIAVKALEEYANEYNWNTENVEGEYVFCFNVKYPWRFTQTALEQIKELDK